MFTIENNLLKITIAAKGAELQSIFHKKNNIEYMWSGDPAFWAKKSPVLFPIVGTLKEDTYYYKDEAYHLSRHGFARELTFDLEEQSTNAITFSIQHSEQTLKNFPFHFHFYVRYELSGDELSVTYGVWNRGNDVMYFSVGGHPAFKLPLVEGTTYNDYFLRFNKKERLGRWPISKQGLIEKELQPLLNDSDELPLSKELFSKDAIVLKHLKSDTVTIESQKTAHGIKFVFAGFPYLGIWASPGSDFVCIEPWQGIADSVDSSQQLENKEGIVSLGAGELFERTWIASFF
jgi:galactose mutarotase-like enzyme